MKVLVKKSKKVKIRELDDDERIAINTGLSLWTTYIPLVYLREHYGEYAVENFFKENAEAQERMFKDIGIKDPMNLFIMNARNMISMFGSDIELRGDDLEATMTVKRCNEMAHALLWSKTAPNMDITRKSHCGICINSRFKPIAMGFGFKYNVNLTDKGCVMTMKKTR